MKIGIVLSTSPGYSETFFLSKIKGLKANGHKVLLFTQTKEEGFSLCNVKLAYPIFQRNIFRQAGWILLVFLKLFWYPKIALNFIKLEKEQGTKFLNIFKKLYASAHILTQKLDWLHFGFATMALGKENVAVSVGAKMAVSLRGFDIAIYLVKHPNCYELLWRKVDKVHTISDDLYKLAIKNGLSKKVPIQKITPAIDTRFFQPMMRKRALDNSLNILTVSRLHWKKGLSYTLRGLAILKEQGENFKYTIVGEGEQYEELMYTIHILNLEENVFLKGKKTQKEIKELMATNDVYLQYSVSEGFCNAVLEAQAMGLLCIVSDAEGLQENVLHEKTGWVVEKRAPMKLATTILMVKELDIKTKNKIIKTAQQRVISDFNMEQQQKSFVEFYKTF